MRNVSRALVGLGLLAGLGCAEDEPGQAPPTDQLHFPISFARLGTSHLLVVSSNFDQRFNAGVLHSIPVDQLFTDAASPPIDRIQETLPAGTKGVRIPSLANQVAIQTEADGSGRAYVTNRSQHSLVYVPIGRDGTPDCTNGSIARATFVDCTPAYLVDTLASDPVSLAILPGRGPKGTILIGHVDQGVAAHGTLSSLDLSRFDDRIEEERAGGITTLAPATSFGLRFDGAVSLTTLSDEAFLIFARAASNSVVPLRRMILDESSLTIVRAEGVNLGPRLKATEARGLALSADGTRAYASVRLEEPRDSTSTSIPIVYDSALAVIDLTGAAPVVVSAVEVGEEIAEPAILERNGRRLVYVPDTRSDRIYVVDASSDRLAVVSTIEGRGVRDVEGRAVRSKMLSAPVAMTFLERGGRTLAVVANFGDDTLAGIDVTDPDPRRHEIVIRWGAALNPDGTREGEQ